jgi:hypothetical protein
MADIRGIRSVLASQASGFKGLNWEPRRLLDLNVLVLVVAVVDELVEEVVDLDVSGLPVAGSIQASQRELRLSSERIRRVRTRDHAMLFREVGTVFVHLSKILEELVRLERTGHLD